MVGGDAEFASCSACGRFAKDIGLASLQQCQGCHTTQYCDRRCQKQHWSRAHKRECKRLASSSQLSPPEPEPKPAASSSSSTTTNKPSKKKAAEEDEALRRLKDEGANLFIRGEYTEAAESYRRALSHRTATTAPLLACALQSNLAACLLKLDQFDDALRVCERVIAEHSLPGGRNCRNTDSGVARMLAKVHVRRAQALDLVGRPREALEKLSTAMAAGVAEGSRNPDVGARKDGMDVLFESIFTREYGSRGVKYAIVPEVHSETNLERFPGVTGTPWCNFTGRAAIGGDKVLLWGGVGIRPGMDSDETDDPKIVEILAYMKRLQMAGQMMDPSERMSVEVQKFMSRCLSNESVYVFDLHTRLWEVIPCRGEPALPVARHRHRMVFVPGDEGEGDAVYMFGGEPTNAWQVQRGSIPFRGGADMWRLSLPDMTWRRASNNLRRRPPACLTTLCLASFGMAYHRESRRIFVISGEVVPMGNNQQRGASNEVFVFDLGSCAWSRVASVTGEDRRRYSAIKRYHFAMAVVDGRYCYLHGGNLDSDSSTTALEEFDMETERWRRLPLLGHCPSNTAEHSGMTFTYPRTRDPEQRPFVLFFGGYIPEVGTAPAAGRTAWDGPRKVEFTDPLRTLLIDNDPRLKGPYKTAFYRFCPRTLMWSVLRNCNMNDVIPAADQWGCQRSDGAVIISGGYGPVNSQREACKPCGLWHTIEIPNVDDCGDFGTNGASGTGVEDEEKLDDGGVWRVCSVFEDGIVTFGLGGDGFTPDDAIACARCLRGEPKKKCNVKGHCRERHRKLYSGERSSPIDRLQPFGSSKRPQHPHQDPMAPVRVLPIQCWMDAKGADGAEGYTIGQDVYHGPVVTARQREVLIELILPDCLQLARRDNLPLSMQMSRCLWHTLQEHGTAEGCKNVRIGDFWFHEGKPTMYVGDYSDPEKSPLPTDPDDYPWKHFKDNGDKLSHGHLLTHYRDTIAASKDMARERGREVAQRPRRHAADADIFTLRVRLTHLEPCIWRRVTVSGHCTLHEFADQLLMPAMGWTRCYHGYAFRPERWDREDGRENGKFIHGDTWIGPENSVALDILLMMPMFGGEWVAPSQKIRVDQLIDSVGDRLAWVHDLGDYWHHTIEVEAVHASADPDAPSPFECLGGWGACPPEDCSGVIGYRDVLTALGLHSLDTSPLARRRDRETALQNLVEAFPERCPEETKSAQYAEFLKGPRSEVASMASRIYWECHHNNITNAKNVTGSHFEPTYFSLAESRDRVHHAVSTRTSRAGDSSKFTMHTVLASDEFGLPNPSLAQPTKAAPPQGGAFKRCALCQVTVGLKACQSCLSVSYCSRQCQERDWPNHKDACANGASKKKKKKKKGKKSGKKK